MSLIVGQRGNTLIKKWRAMEDFISPTISITYFFGYCVIRWCTNNTLYNCIFNKPFGYITGMSVQSSNSIDSDR